MEPRIVVAPTHFMKRERGPSKLVEYRKKRRPEATNEPFGGELPSIEDESLPRSGKESETSGAFVVHLHDATRRHYDLRLEVGGVLASFAIPHGPSLDPDDKHLAVHTEDHPLEYLEFEDVIPDHQYGAGPMIAWDRGSVEFLEGPGEEEIAKGKIHVELRGLKLRGRWALVKLAKSEKGNEWLFFKKQDEHASKEKKLVELEPRSVFSGLTVDELAHAQAIGDALVARAKKLGAKPLARRARGDAHEEIFGASRSPLVVAADGAGRKLARDVLHDVELDGVRVLATRDGDVVSLRTWSTGGAPQAIEAFYPEVVRALRALPVSRVALDGELVAFDASGRPSVKRLADRVARIANGDVHRATTTSPVVLVAKDVLAIGDLDTRPLPLRSRREALGALLPSVGFLRAAPPLEGPLDAVLRSCAAHGLLGVVTKRASSPYASDPKDPAWLAFDGDARRPRVTIDHRASEAAAALRRVEVTNRSKIFWPDEGLTKGDLCDYYAKVAPVILPYLADRPVILVRYPDGIAGKSFYQWNVPPGMPAWIRTLEVDDEDDEKKRGFLVDDASTLLYIANLACIPLHILACRVPRLHEADFLTVDFDVKQSELRHAITLAIELREILERIGLPGYPKTSGQSGLHVLVPLGGERDGRGRQGFTTARVLADLLGTLLVQRYPEIATMERIVARRGPRVYVDTGQTGQTRAIVAPYSVRAVAGATVSTPLTWAEVGASLDPRAFDLRTVPARVAKHGDPMAGMLEAKPDVARAVAKLSELVR